MATDQSECNHSLRLQSRPRMLAPGRKCSIESARMIPNFANASRRLLRAHEDPASVLNQPPAGGLETGPISDREPRQSEWS